MTICGNYYYGIHVVHLLSVGLKPKLFLNFLNKLHCTVSIRVGLTYNVLQNNLLAQRLNFAICFIKAN